MADVEETRLPGVGVRYDFKTSGGDRIGVIAHASGHRDLLVYDEDDPDACSEVVRLDEDDSATLADLLGASHVHAHLTDIQQSVEGLTIDWLPVVPDAACAGRTIATTGTRLDGEVSIVAVVRGKKTIPSPPADFRLQPGDTAVAVGTPEAIRNLFDLLTRGTG
jgi:TrkA domain protein